MALADGLRDGVAHGGRDQTLAGEALELGVGSLQVAQLARGAAVQLQATGGTVGARGVVGWPAAAGAVGRQVAGRLGPGAEEGLVDQAEEHPQAVAAGGEDGEEDQDDEEADAQVHGRATAFPRGAQCGIVLFRRQQVRPDWIPVREDTETGRPKQGVRPFRSSVGRARI